MEKMLVPATASNSRQFLGCLCQLLPQVFGLVAEATLCWPGPSGFLKLQPRLSLGPLRRRSSDDGPRLTFEEEPLEDCDSVRDSDREKLAASFTFPSGASKVSPVEQRALLSRLLRLLLSLDAVRTSMTEGKGVIGAGGVDEYCKAGSLCTLLSPHPALVPSTHGDFGSPAVAGGSLSSAKFKGPLSALFAGQSKSFWCNT